MACLVVILLGTEALRRLPVDLMPDITYPTISITTIYDGAGPAEIETMITRPIEQSVSSVQGVDSMTSSSQEGSSTVTVRFEWNRDLDSAIGDIRARIERLRATLPEDVEPTYIRRYDICRLANHLSWAQQSTGPYPVDATGRKNGHPAIGAD
jgi:HAE1 family hydrophobic/amphiphilic exporter-1